MTQQIHRPPIPSPCPVGSAVRLLVEQRSPVDFSTWEHRHIVGVHSPLILLVDLASRTLNALDQFLTLPELLLHKLHSLFQDETLGAALTLEARDQLRQAVEALADGLASLLLCQRASSTC